MTTKTKFTPYEMITNQITEALNAGVVPWRKGWVASGLEPTSLSTGRAYRGSNYLLLSMLGGFKGYDSKWWGTYKQIEAKGGKVAKGSLSTKVTLWKPFETEDKDTGEKETRFALRYFNVFNADQADWEPGTKPSTEAQTARTSAEKIAEAEALIEGYIANGGPEFAHDGQDRAFYRPSADKVSVPTPEAFLSDEEYYSVVFHELGHSTGHKTRLNRPNLMENHHFGDPAYSQEELVAEFTAAFLSGVTGIAPKTVDNSASYIASWHKALKNDPKMLLKAAAAAQKAADHIRGVTYTAPQPEED
jgi:antirestriction protein ArdC